MRALTWLLLALNAIAAAVWLAGFELPPPAPAAPPPPSSGAKPLQLLSELPQLPPRLEALPGDSGPAAASGDAAAPEPVELAVPADAGGTLIAVTPPADAPPVAAAAPADSPAPAAANESPPPASACYRTAPLGADAYEDAGNALRAAGLGEPRLQPPARVRERYWVYWSGSAEQLDEVETKLKAAGLRDWYRQRGPGGELRLSLGVYGQLDSARRRQRELAARGIQAQISPRYPPQARLRWTITAAPATVEAARPRLQAQGVSLEPCP
jgi:hypothetical protein